MWGKGPVRVATYVQMCIEVPALEPVVGPSGWRKRRVRSAKRGCMVGVGTRRSIAGCQQAMLLIAVAVLITTTPNSIP